MERLLHGRQGMHEEQVCTRSSETANREAVEAEAKAGGADGGHGALDQHAGCNGAQAGQERAARLGMCHLWRSELDQSCSNTSLSEAQTVTLTGSSEPCSTRPPLLLSTITQNTGMPTTRGFEISTHWGDDTHL